MKQGHNNSQNVAIYARVSHVKQVAEGHGLESQITRCREFAEQQGYNVAAVFTDEITGRVEKRPGMKAMTSFLKKKANNTHIVIIDDISRLARNVQTHWKIRDQIAAVGANIESPNFEF
ncbi:recombinase family protein [Shimia sp. R9_2]|uniref:recombinase family protein n=1 Tax=Shimia sp. R9_2 TaxID=2821112 RepID=UPI001ADA8BDA|nr:recombinase family protein [Shimia sp. R9_2]MBO9397204.1 recombinase family protein [Shimia sp. R9_2]